MPLITKIVSLFTSDRMKQINHFKENPHETQDRQLKQLLKHGEQTSYGRERAIKKSDTIEQFQQKLEIADYEAYCNYIARTKNGEQGVIWDDKIKFFAKSSGTTDYKSKFVPVTHQGLQDSHLRGSRDVVTLLSHVYPESNIFNGKTLTLGGSHKIENNASDIIVGDLSAILIENTPKWANYIRVPSKKTALIPDFDKKVELICKESMSQDVRAFAGVPSWNLVLMNRILEYTGKKNLLEVWPNMELFIHGGMNFKPYKAQYEKLIPSNSMKYIETYNASEGFFAIGDDPSKDDMLLMLDYNTFYEFLPLDSLSTMSNAVPLEGVKMGVVYAMIITSSNALWRYMIGDTVEFTSTSPYRIKIIGRTKHFINAFGEEVMVDNAEDAMHTACQQTNSKISEFSVAPIYMEGTNKGTHEWVIEFAEEPKSLTEFTTILDKTLQSVNSDYQAKRDKDTTLAIPKVTIVTPGTFFKWMASRNKLGGQNKVPRLFNTRQYVDELLSI